MARPECALSLELEQRMNLFLRIGTIEEHIFYGGSIDEADDLRRMESFGIDKYNKDMMIHFSKLLKKGKVVWNISQLEI